MNHGLSDATVKKIQDVLSSFPQVEKAVLRFALRGHSSQGRISI